MSEIRYASRKFVVACFLIVEALVLLVARIIDQDTWLTISMGITALYVTGNIGASLVRATTRQPEGKQ